MIDIKDLEKGMKVVVGNSISQTHNRFNSCNDMHKMKGKMFTVEDVEIANNACHFKGFSWDPADLEFPEVKEQEPVIIHFDPQYL